MIFFIEPNDLSVAWVNFVFPASFDSTSVARQPNFVEQVSNALFTNRCRFFFLHLQKTLRYLSARSFVPEQNKVKKKKKNSKTKISSLSGTVSAVPFIKSNKTPINPPAFQLKKQYRNQAKESLHCSLMISRTCIF